MSSIYWLWKEHRSRAATLERLVRSRARRMRKYCLIQVIDRVRGIGSRDFRLRSSSSRGNSIVPIMRMHSLLCDRNRVTVRGQRRRCRHRGYEQLRGDVICIQDTLSSWVTESRCPRNRRSDSSIFDSRRREGGFLTLL
jgi:hypothetical protein